MTAVMPATVREDGTAAAAAVRAARRGQPPWAALTTPERAARLRGFGGRLAREGDRLADLLVGAGRERGESWTAEILPTVDAVRWLTGEGARALRPRRLAPSALQWYLSATRHTLTWAPHGVVGIVTPSNAPLFLAVPQIAGALLAGNAVVWKPAPTTDAVAAHVVQAMRRAGIPADALSMLAGGADTARALVAAGVDKLHFTGTSRAGLALYGVQAQQGRPAVLELSGRHVAVALAPCDVGEAARAIVWSTLANAGRNCIAVQQLLVQRGLVSSLMPALARAIDDAAATVAVREETMRRRIASLVADAVQRGARLAAGTPDALVVLTDVAPGMRVVDDEIQAPILTLAVVDSVAAAVARVNGAPYRLSASVWTADTRLARAVAARLDVGQVWINEQLHPAAQPRVPLAGRGASGFGASRGVAGLMEMVTPKVVSETPRWMPRPQYRALPSASAALGRHTLAAARRLGWLA